MFTVGQKVKGSGENVWIICKQIGEKSMFGVIYQVCLNSRKSCKKYVLKYIKFGSNTTKEMFLNEVFYQKKAAEKGLSVDIIDVLYTENYGIIVMPMLKDTMLNEIIKILKSNKKDEEIVYSIINLLKIAITLIQKLNKIGIYHGDPNINNIMYITRSGEKKWLFIDFGYSFDFKEKKEREKKDKKDDFYFLIISLVELYYFYSTSIKFLKLEDIKNITQRTRYRYHIDHLMPIILKNIKQYLPYKTIKRLNNYCKEKTQTVNQFTENKLKKIF